MKRRSSEKKGQKKKEKRKEERDFAIKETTSSTINVHILRTGFANFSPFAFLYLFYSRRITFEVIEFLTLIRLMKKLPVEQIFDISANKENCSQKTASSYKFLRLCPIWCESNELRKPVSDRLNLDHFLEHLGSSTIFQIIEDDRRMC